GHDMFHVQRVYQMALQLASFYEVDNEVVALASILHDLDDPKISENTHFVSRFLSSADLDSGKKTMIQDIINNMSFSKQKEGAMIECLEGKIVQDADRLDAIGAIGIARCFAYGGAKHRAIYLGDNDDSSSLAHFYQKLLKLEDLMNLEESRMIAHERTKLMKEFLTHFHEDFNLGVI
ncbi:MAG: HD domain-containing protein, partial [Candidatus Izemoplasmatales bacterium]